MKLRLEKTYADLVMDDGTLCVAYVYTVTWGPWHRTYAGAQLFRGDGGHDTVRMNRPATDGLATRIRSAEGLRFRDAGREFRLCYGAGLPRWTPPEPALPEGLRWRVEIPRAEGTLRWPGVRGRLEGTGYVDRILLERSLRRIDMRRLAWGRAHLPTGSLVYVELELGTTPPWRRASWWPSTEIEPQVSEVFDLDTGAGEAPWSMSLPGAGGLQLDATRARLVHRGTAVEAIPRPGLLERAAACRLGGTLQDERWLDRVRVVGSASPAGWLVRELVSR